MALRGRGDKIKIQEIKTYLLQHPQYFSKRNNVNIEDIKTAKEYYFISDCGHEFLSPPQRVIKERKIGCPFCSGRRILKGFNDIKTTSPKLASMLQNPEDGYTLSLGSNKKVLWVCPDCGNIFYNSPNKMSQNKSYCPNCNKISSYGETFFAAFLNQLCVPYEREKSFLWSDSKRYDFYLPQYHYIVEIHGSQHFSSYGFSKLGGRNHIQEQENDKYKKEIALNNGINEYITIQSIKPSRDSMKNNILNSLLPTLLFFDCEDIDWNLCHEECMTGVTKEICDYYESTEKDIAKIAKQFQRSYNTIRKRLKDGALMGWCSYSVEQARKDGVRKTVSNMLKSRSVPVIQIDTKTGRIIEEYESLQSAQRILHVSHIWDCIVGKRKTAGGYAWAYKKEDAIMKTDIKSEK